jgi:hypothetical protein
MPRASVELAVPVCSPGGQSVVHRSRLLVPSNKVSVQRRIPQWTGVKNRTQSFSASADPATSADPAAPAAALQNGGSLPLVPTELYRVICFPAIERLQRVRRSIEKGALIDAQEINRHGALRTQRPSA